MTGSGTESICRHQLTAMRDGDLSDFEGHVHPKATNREAVDEPLACRGHGPPAFHATGLMLRCTFAELAWKVHDVAAEDDLVVAHTTMSGRQTGTLFSYDVNGRVNTAFPPTGERFAVTQTHWWGLADGLLIEHWANRDDLGMGEQLGWIPPTPLYMARMALTLFRVRRVEARKGGPIAMGHAPDRAGRLPLSGRPGACSHASEAAG